MVSPFFADTSALAKRYLVETGTNWVVGQIEPPTQNTVIISQLTMVEMRSLLARRVREKILTPEKSEAIKNDFLIHTEEEYLVVLLDTHVLTIASKLLDQHILRALDAIQLACALYAHDLLDEPITFLSADNNLLQAAAAEGFATDNPNSHP